MSEVFEKQYMDSGFDSQRKYPNTSWIASVAPIFFNLSAQDRKVTKFLELGCCSGANLWMAAKEGFNVTGVDSSEEGLRLCTKMLEYWGASAELVLGSMTDLPFEEGAFDLIYDVVSLQHLDLAGHKDCLQEAKRCLKEGGIFYSYHLGSNSISFQSTEDYIDKNTIKNIEPGYPIENNGPTCFLSISEYRAILEEAGFKEIVIESETRTYKNGQQLLEYLNVVAVA